ncbi:MAG: polysaccharide biosynthesis C-terminal domain-containing protein, partial [Pseudomonadales bacterium]|nr:polysaccharide biosynthesis C-terminal domain-containing protein [Pseudomonadales bacterium]
MTDTITNKNNNVFLTGSLTKVFIKTAAPIILMMLVNGSFNLVDAYFLGFFVGADALSAVTSMFPLFMLLVALSTLVSTGFASVMARLLGAAEITEAKDTFAQAITLSSAVCALLIVFFALFGHTLTLAANDGAAELAQMSYQYMAILIFGSPLMFILTINSDSLRCEGHAGIMALASLLTVLLNGCLNYVLIAIMEYGVAGSAIGTVLAQFFALLVIAGFRRSKRNRLPIQAIHWSKNRNHWRDFLALGAPSSLTYIGIALSSAAILFNLQVWSESNYATTVGAYGIITRLMTFVFL